MCLVRNTIHRLEPLSKGSKRHKRSGRRRITISSDNRYLLQYVSRQRTLTAGIAASQLLKENPYPFQTVSRRLHEGGQFAR
ncbi:hypothetical protein HNY73_022924 [Argiope bruennichi]|uniref:Transposase Tc1-like domain-containing protein n=1 Tax=Argiope bruennichi TaxID=94029 RepID=A0A8T0E2H7_ARGBR|nr:hypothetical protein HNY73_022924 [Argiope bruennichi]